MLLLKVFPIASSASFGNVKKSHEILVISKNRTIIKNVNFIVFRFFIKKLIKFSILQIYKISRWHKLAGGSL